MGIVNATPDSFSGDGTVGDAALHRALKMVEDGAEILYIGGAKCPRSAAQRSDQVNFAVIKFQNCDIRDWLWPTSTHFAR